MNVFLSYAVGPSEGSIPERLSAVAAAYGISLLLPDRTYLRQIVSTPTQWRTSRKAMPS